MAKFETEIVVDDPTAPADDSPPVVGTRSVDIVVYLLLLALAALLGFDNWRTGMGWAAGRPAGRLLPVLSVGHPRRRQPLRPRRHQLARGTRPTTFVTRDQFRRVMQVFVPTLLFCLFMQWLGLYVASFLLVAGFMWFIGRIALWKSLLTSFLFSLIMFVTFEIAFDVIMPKGPLEALFG